MRLFPVFLAVAVAFSAASHAAPGTASASLYGQSLNLFPSTQTQVSGLSVAFLFSTFNGSTGPFLQQTTTTGELTSGELRPQAGSPGFFEGDYAILAAPLLLDYGSYAVSGPTADTTGLGIPDVLNYSLPGSFSATGSGSDIQAGGAPFTMSFVFSRAANSALGTYTATTLNQYGGSIVTTGQFALVDWQGTVTYSRGSTNTLNLSLANLDGTSGSLAGSTTYAVAANGQVNYAAFTAIGPGGNSYQVLAGTLTRTGNAYLGSLQFVDGQPLTSWADYTQNQIQIIDPNNKSGDGIPDFSDPLAAPPAISNQPVSQAVFAGASVSFSVAAAGASTYQWYDNGSAIPGATGTTLTLGNVQAGNAGSYTVTATNAAGTVTSGAATLTLLAPAVAPSFSLQPASQTGIPGGNITFTATATGNPAPTYQWYFNGAAIAGATTSALSLSNLGGGSAGTYAVVATNAGGSISSSTATLIISVTPAPVFTTAPQNQSSGPGQTVTFTAAASGSPTYQWLFNGTPIAGATNSTLTLPAITGAAAGTYSVVATNANGSTSISSATLAVAVLAPPVFTAEPASQTVATGGTVVLTSSANGVPTPTFQWDLNGKPIPNATGNQLVISAAAVANGGTYTCIATNSQGSATSFAAVVSLASTTDVGRLINLSVNATAGKNQILTVGFVTGGTGTGGSQNLLIRGTGPALAAFGVANPLADPTLKILSGQSVVASNDNWATPATNQSAVTAADAATFAFPLANPASLDAALATSLPTIAGGYTVQISGNTAASGTALAEVYDNTPAASYTSATPRLINISANNLIPANGSMTAGFVIGGSTPETVLIRATGPALAALGVQGAMPDPQLMVHTTASGHDTVLASNAGWGGDPQLTAASNAVGAFPLTNAASKDSVVLLSLSPGSYTAVASSVTGTAGTALIEVYEVR